MIRGMIIVTCPHCGKTFVAPDIEWGATVFSAPVSCPHCSQTVDPNGHKGLCGIVKKLMKRIGFAGW